MRTSTLHAVTVGLIALGITAAMTDAKHRAAGVTADQIAAARMDGYRTGLTHAALGLLNPPAGGGTADNYARGKTDE